ncbi:MAG: hypothetical protein JWP20_949 [Roseomonas sp.]|nr:hypothetical protein [Roseomonas sp.]
MSIFGSIMSKIFGHQAAAAQANVTPADTTATAAPAPATPAVPAAASPAAPLPSTPMPATPAVVTASAGPVDVNAVLTDLAAKNGQNLNWKQSIVDLMKLLNLDSSLEARKALAKELNYTGDTGDSASMNIWLHKQVMTKLAENGGKVPAELRD